MIKVYVIDDDRDINQMIIDYLENEGFSVEGALSGENIISKICNFMPDVIICDLILTPLSGQKIFYKVKRHMDIAHIPFVFLSAVNIKEEVLQALEMGADDYFVKPIQLKALKERILHLVKVSPHPADLNLKIMLTDKNESVLRKFEQYFKSSFYEMIPVSSIKEALKALKNTNLDIIVSAQNLKDGTAYDFCKKVKKDYGNLDFLLLVNKGDFEAIRQGTAAGVDDFVFNNLGIDGLKIKLNRAINKILESKSFKRYAITDNDVLSILKKCEVQGLTGDLQIHSSHGDGSIEMRKGEYLNIKFNDLKEADALETLAALADGEIIVNFKYMLI